MKLVPVMVTAVPPLMVPVLGLTELTVLGSTDDGLGLGLVVGRDVSRTRGSGTRVLVTAAHRTGLVGLETARELCGHAGEPTRTDDVQGVPGVSAHLARLEECGSELLELPADRDGSVGGLTGGFGGFARLPQRG